MAQPLRPWVMHTVCRPIFEGLLRCDRALALQPQVVLIKHWSKQRRLNDAYVGTLSSYAYVLMAICHLQRRRPPVLPCLQEMQPTFSRQCGERPMREAVWAGRGSAAVHRALDQRAHPG